MVIGEIAMSFSISYMSPVVEMRQIIVRTRQQFDKDGCGIAWGFGGGKCSNRSTRQGQQPASATVQRATTSACRSPAVVGSVYSKQHFLLVAGRQKCQPLVTAALRNSLRFFA